MMAIKCPKCGYLRLPTDPEPDYECPSCGIVYAKFTLQEKLASAAPQPPSKPDPQPPIQVKEPSPPPRRTEVVVKDIDLPFWSMVGLFIQMGLAPFRRLFCWA